jgi:hypothetical protein
MRALRHAWMKPIGAAALAAVLLGACGSAPAKRPEASKPTPSSSTTGTSGTGTPGGGSTKSSTSTSTSGGTGTTSGTGSTKPGATASPSPSHSPIPITATITPRCVRPGGQATIVVQTLPQSAVAFDTYYSNGKTGGSPPLGDGLGGNDGGMTDKNGRYTSTWVVSPHAPAGPAYARVIVGHGDSTDETRALFAVSDSTGDC